VIDVANEVKYGGGPMAHSDAKRKKPKQKKNNVLVSIHEPLGPDEKGEPESVWLAHYFLVVVFKEA
jgi:hypothetical protein